jgi:hypothetical protein
MAMGFFTKLTESYWEIYRKNNAVIRNPDKIDLMITKDGGGVELYIITDEHCLDSSPKTQQLIRDKVERYLIYINSDDFKNNVPNLSKEKTDIIIKFNIQPESVLLEFIKSMIPWTHEHNTNLLITIKNKFYEIR